MLFLFDFSFLPLLYCLVRMMNLAPQGIVGWGEVEGADLGPLPIEAQHVGMSESVHTPEIKDSGGGGTPVSLPPLCFPPSPSSPGEMG